MNNKTTIIALLLSPLLSVSAFAETDLTKDAMYKCVDDVSIYIEDGEAKKHRAYKYNMKVKSGNVTFIEPSGFPNIDSKRDSDSYLRKNMMTVSAMGSSLNVTAKENEINFSFTYVMIADDILIKTYISQGTCTKQ